MPILSVEAGEGNMVSKYDLAIGVLVLIAGIIIYSFAPGGALFVGGAEQATTHYVGGFIAIIIGLVGVALYRNLGRVEVGVSVLSVISGVLFILEAPGLLYADFGPHAFAMEAVGGLTILIGLIGIGAAFLTRKSTLMKKA